MYWCGPVTNKIKEYLCMNVNCNLETLAEKRDRTAEKIMTAQKYNEVYFNGKHKKPVQYKEEDLVMLRNFDSSAEKSKKLIPQYKRSYVVKRELRNNRYLIADINRFQNI